MKEEEEHLVTYQAQCVNTFNALSFMERVYFLFFFVTDIINLNDFNIYQYVTNILHFYKENVFLHFAWLEG